MASKYIQSWVSDLITHHDERVFEHQAVARVGDVETEVVGQPLIPIIEGLGHEGVEDRSGTDRKYRVYNDERWPGGLSECDARIEAGLNGWHARFTAQH